MAKYPLSKRAIIVYDHLVNHCKFHEIATKIAGVTPRGMQMLCQQIRKFASDDNIKNLLLHLELLARPAHQSI